MITTLALITVGHTFFCKHFCLKYKRQLFSLIIDLKNFSWASNCAKSNILRYLQMVPLCVADCGNPNGSTVYQGAATDRFAGH